MREIIELFATFVKIGCVTFGGGYAILPVLERILIQQKHWVTMDEVMRYWSVAQITPGIISVNLATFIGFKRKRLLGGIIATLGFVAPSVAFIAIIATTLSHFAELPLVRHCFSGIRIAVAALVMDTVFSMIAKIPQKGAPPLRNIITLAVCILSALASFIWKTNPALIVAAAACAGFLLGPHIAGNKNGAPL